MKKAMRNETSKDRERDEEEKREIETNIDCKIYIRNCRLHVGNLNNQNSIYSSSVILQSRRFDVSIASAYTFIWEYRDAPTAFHFLNLRDIVRKIVV